MPSEEEHLFCFISCFIATMEFKPIELKNLVGIFTSSADLFDLYNQIPQDKKFRYNGNKHDTEPILATRLKTRMSEALPIPRKNVESQTAQK